VRAGSGRAEVAVVGAGHAGLSVAEALLRHGLQTVVLEREQEVGRPWRDRYRALRLNTERWGSRLRGAPRLAGPERWPSGADFADYLTDFASRHLFDIRFQVTATRVDVTQEACTVRTSRGDIQAPFAVLATGPDRQARLPDVPGLSRWPGELLHAGDYREAGPYVQRSVLVVGGGESAADIAVDLVRGGVRDVSLSVRTPPHILRPDFLGVPAQALAILARGQPPKLFDALAALMRRVTIGDLTAYGLGRPPSLHQTARAQGKAPILDRGFVRLLRSGRIRIRPALVAVTPGGACLADGSTVRVDVLILATGYRPGLEPIVGHLGLLSADGRPLVAGPRTHPRAPNLFFAGYTPELSGNIREAARTAARIAREIDRRSRAYAGPVLVPAARHQPTKEEGT
jgi:cation diffusion facilitator CzcD-associated flavoprotein CzcO